MIRAATVADIPALLEMGRKFADEAGVTARVGWDEESVEAMLEGLIEDPDGIVLVSERGMIGGMVYAHPFNRNVRAFVEVFWRAEDGQGLALLNAAEAQARALGATKSVMVAMDGMERTARLYARLGYTPCEAQFMKELS
jgi:N-acetylglutamate synthase-like GNAT family acetyltransferase